MKILIIALLALSACVPYTKSQVGPDRYAFSSRHADAADQTRLLQSAYETCKMNGYKDYGIVSYGPSPDGGSSLLVQCRNTTEELKTQSPVVVYTPPMPPQQQAVPVQQPASSWSDTAGKLYGQLKASFQ